MLDDICAVYPAKMGEIIDIGFDEFQKYLGAILASKPSDIMIKGEKEMTDFLRALSDFQYMLFIATMDKEIETVLKDSFRFFCHEEIVLSFEAEQIIIGPVSEQHILTEDKFYELQHLIRCMYFLEETEDEETLIRPDDDPRVRALKEQRARYHKKLEEVKRKEANNGDGSSDIKLSDLLGSITLNDCNLNIANVWDITYYAFHDQLRRMGWRDQFNINHRAALAGAKVKDEQLKHWIRSIHLSKTN